MLVHSASAGATGTDHGYLEASRPKQVSNEAVIAQRYVTAKKELKVNDLSRILFQTKLFLVS